MTGGRAAAGLVHHDPVRGRAHSAMHAHECLRLESFKLHAPTECSGDATRGSSPAVDVRNVSRVSGLATAARSSSGSRESQRADSVVDSPDRRLYFFASSGFFGGGGGGFAPTNV